jgi:hypothetical protein
MARQRTSVEFKVDGRTIAALTTEPVPDSPRPLIAALHGGSYTSRYFDVAGSPERQR